MKINFISDGCVADDALQRNLDYAKSLGLPHPRQSQYTRLAVVGGGPSVASQIDVIKKYPAKWMCASAFPYLYSKGIRGTYFNIDPSEDCINETANVTHAILGSGVHRGVFDALIAKGADVSIFDLVHDGVRQNHGVSTPTATTELAILMGFKKIVFFGCESSFGEQTHAYRNDYDTNPIWMVVKVGDDLYYTRPDYFIQAQYLAEMIKHFPHVFSEKSGGLLRAMVKHDDHDIVEVSKALYATLNIKKVA